MDGQNLNGLLLLLSICCPFCSLHPFLTAICISTHSFAQCFDVVCLSHSACASLFRSVYKQWGVSVYCHSECLKWQELCKCSLFLCSEDVKLSTSEDASAKCVVRESGTPEKRVPASVQPVSNCSKPGSGSMLSTYTFTGTVSY